jgi:Outer membrane lipoprotein-sorting protein
MLRAGFPRASLLQGSPSQAALLRKALLQKPLATLCRFSCALIPVFAVGLGGVLLASSVNAADEPKAREIMTRVDERDDGDNQTSNLEMVLIDKRGKQRVRELRSFTKDVDVDTHSMLFFLSPADVEDTGFLTYDYDDPDRDDDQWLYLPALKKTKRIASSDKSGSFMGSDFSYADMTDRPLERYEFKLLKEDEVGGHPVWIIESTPIDDDEIDETGYTKSIQFVRKDIDLVIRSKIWVKKGKRNKYMEVQELEQIEGIWVPTLITMTTKNGKQTIHKTVLRTDNVKFNQDLKLDDFSIRRLETGP